MPGKSSLISLLFALLFHQRAPISDAFSFGIKSRSTPNRLFSSKISTSWDNLTVPELKFQLKERKLPVSGNKAELIKRLKEHSYSSDVDTESNDNSTKNSQAKNKKKTRFPPPKDKKYVESMQKEITDTIRMLEGFKLGSPSNEANVPSLSDLEGVANLTRRQQEMMKSLKESLHSTQYVNRSTKQIKPQETLPLKQQARMELLEHHKEQLRMRPANDLKEELTSLRLSIKGRKPDLVLRLAEYYLTQEMSDGSEDQVAAPIIPPSNTLSGLDEAVISFAGIPRLSTVATNALCQAFGDESGNPLKPTPIQAVAISKLFYPPQPSAILHAPTGSGKTLTYLLPITESLWREVKSNQVDPTEVENGVALILLPTRELAAQVAGVATVLAPNGMVRFVPHPMDLMKKSKIDAGAEYAYFEEHGDEDRDEQALGQTYSPRIIVGSAKSLAISLFGDGKMPGTPTKKPDGKRLLSSVRWLVMDEVDRLLNIKTSRTDRTNKRHEKPAALLAASVARLTMGRTQVIAASATVGRPLRRELSRVLGLHSSECPETLRGEDDSARLEAKLQSKDDDKHIGRAVKIPITVRNYVLPVDGSTTGTLLTSAAFAAKAMMRSLNQEESTKKVLLVLTRNCDIKVHNALGALKHFGIRPEPQSLLDALETDGSDRLIEVHRRVSGVIGVGGSKQSISNDSKGYLLITHEDNVRGLHLDGLDGVIVVGRPGSPDEYTHIAGRTGRAGRHGSVLNVVSFEQAAALTSWQKMLGVDFLPLDESEVSGILDG